MAGEREHVFDKPRNVRRLLYALYSICALLLAIEKGVRNLFDTPVADFRSSV